MKLRQFLTVLAVGLALSASWIGSGISGVARSVPTQSAVRNR